jgi:hypothetical protein
MDGSEMVFGIITSFFFATRNCEPAFNQVAEETAEGLRYELQTSLEDFGKR